MQWEVKKSAEDEGGEEAIYSEGSVGEQFVNGRSAVHAISCIKSTPRTANKLTQQPSSRKHPGDSLCMSSMSYKIRVERRHLVK
jgi:hypothetical protein